MMAPRHATNFRKSNVHTDTHIPGLAMASALSMHLLTPQEKRKRTYPEMVSLPVPVLLVVPEPNGAIQCMFHRSCCFTCVFLGTCGSDSAYDTAARRLPVSLSGIIEIVQIHRKYDIYFTTYVTYFDNS